MRFQQCCNIKFVHLHHGLQYCLCLAWVRVSHQLTKHDWDDLPRYPELVFQPTTTALLAATGGELCTKAIHFFLCVTAYVERYSISERERWAAIEPDKALALQFKFR